MPRFKKLWLSNSANVSVRISWEGAHKVIVEPKTYRDFQALIDHLETALTGVQLFATLTRQPSLVHQDIKVVSPARSSPGYRVPELAWAVSSTWEGCLCLRASALPERITIAAIKNP